VSNKIHLDDEISNNNKIQQI